MIHVSWMFILAASLFEIALSKRDRDVPEASGVLHAQVSPYSLAEVEVASLGVKQGESDVFQNVTPVWTRTREVGVSMVEVHAGDVASDIDCKSKGYKLEEVEGENEKASVMKKCLDTKQEATEEWQFCCKKDSPNTGEARPQQRGKQPNSGWPMNRQVAIDAYNDNLIEAIDPTDSSPRAAREMKAIKPTTTKVTTPEYGAVVREKEVWRMSQDGQQWVAKIEFDQNDFMPDQGYTGGQKCYSKWDGPDSTKPGPFRMGWCCDTGCKQCFQKSKFPSMDWEEVPDDPQCRCPSEAMIKAMLDECQGKELDESTPENPSFDVEGFDPSKGECKTKYTDKERYKAALTQARGCFGDVRYGDDPAGVKYKMKEIPCHKVWRRVLLNQASGLDDDKVLWVRNLLFDKVSWGDPSKKGNDRVHARNAEFVCRNPTKYGMGFCFAQGVTKWPRNPQGNPEVDASNPNANLGLKYPFQFEASLNAEQRKYKYLGMKYKKKNLNLALGHPSKEWREGGGCQGGMKP